MQAQAQQTRQLLGARTPCLLCTLVILSTAGACFSRWVTATRPLAASLAAVNDERCDMPPWLIRAWNYTGCNQTAAGLLCPRGGFLQYSADCRMYAELYWPYGPWLWTPFQPWHTQFYQGLVVPAPGEAGCVDHVVTDASHDVMNAVTAIRPGAINNRCPYLSEQDPNVLLIRVTDTTPWGWNMEWRRHVGHEIPELYDFTCGWCDLSFADAVTWVREHFSAQSGSVRGT